MNWNKWIRQTHRWLSVAFTVAVIINVVARGAGEYTSKLGLLAVAPLAFLWLTGSYLFMLPYATKCAAGGASLPLRMCLDVAGNCVALGSVILMGPGA